MQKSTKIKIAAVSVQAVPVFTVLGLYTPMFVERTNTALSAASLFVMLVCAMLFRDTFKNFLAKPTAFKTSVIICLLSYIAMSIGEQLFIISLTSVCSSLAASPLNSWYDIETGKKSKDDFIQQFEKMLGGATGENRTEQSAGNSKT